jgi:hypothetical protein
MKKTNKRRNQRKEEADPSVPDQAGQRGEALDAPEGTEFVESLMVPVMVSLGCSSCRVLMEPLRLAPSLIDVPGQKTPPAIIYGCHKCKKEVRFKAQLPMMQHRRYEDTLELRDQMVIDDERQRSRAEETDGTASAGPGPDSD